MQVDDNIFKDVVRELDLYLEVLKNILTDRQLNALSYHHGGWTKDINHSDSLHALAVLLHMADLMSVNVIN
jgi:hypothetical protein